MMSEQCCMGGPASRRPVRRLFKGAASILPGVALAFLPKCPLCLAAWLTAMTGVGFSAGGVAWVSGIVVIFWVAAVTLVATRSFGGVRLGVRHSSTALPIEGESVESSDVWGLHDEGGRGSAQNGNAPSVLG